MNRRELLPAVLLVLFALDSSVLSEEWARFRGPNGSGVSNATTIPIHWTEKDYNWKIKLPGVGHSSPVLWDGRIFLTCSEDRGCKASLLCIGAADGRILWQHGYETKRRPQHSDNCFASSTPAVDEDRVYLTWGAPDQLVLLAVDHSGRQRWRWSLGTFDGGHGSAISPIICNGLVVLANDHPGKSFLAAVDRNTGKTRWRIERGSAKASYATPCIFQPKGQPPQLIFGSTADGLVGVDPDTGSVNWTLTALPRNTPSTRWVSSPTTAAGLVIATYAFGSHGLQAVAVRPGSKDSNTSPVLEYTIEKCVPSVPSPLVNGELLFLCTNDGVLSCHQVLTGRRLWSERLEGDFYASPICVNGRLYCTSKKGDVFVIAASESFELLAHNPLGERTYATPAVADGRMYLRTYSHLISIGGE